MLIRQLKQNILQEMIWTRTILQELGFKQQKSTTIWEDNSGCIAISKNPIHSNRLKHIDLKYHYVRNQVKEEYIFQIL